MKSSKVIHHPGRDGEQFSTVEDQIEDLWSDINDLKPPDGPFLEKDNNLSDLDDAATAFDNIKQAATASEPGVLVTLQKVWAPWLIPAPEDKDYPVIVGAAEAFTITSVTTKTAMGTATVTVKINGTPLGGDPNSATTSKSTESHSSDNEVSAGDDITITVSDTSSAEDLSITIAGTMELATA